MSAIVHFLSFIEPIFAWNVPLVCLIFLKRSLVFPILLFSSISLHCSLRKAFLSLLAILWNSVFRWVYLSFSPLPFTFLFQLFVRPPQITIFLFAFLFIEDESDHCLLSMLWTPIHNSSGTRSDLIPWIYLSLSLYIHKRFDLAIKIQKIKTISKQLGKIFHFLHSKMFYKKLIC